MRPRACRSSGTGTSRARRAGASTRSCSASRPTSTRAEGAGGDGRLRPAASGDGFGERYFADIQESVHPPGLRGAPADSLARRRCTTCSRPATRTTRSAPTCRSRTGSTGYHVREQLGAFARCRPLNDLTEDARAAHRHAVALRASPGRLLLRARDCSAAAPTSGREVRALLAAHARRSSSRKDEAHPGLLHHRRVPGDLGRATSASSSARPGNSTWGSILANQLATDLDRARPSSRRRSPGTWP